MTPDCTAARPLGRSDLDAPRFATAVCEALFAAVLINDEVGETLTLPNAIQLDQDAGMLVTCFRLSRQVWIDGCDWAVMRTLATRLVRHGDLDADDRVVFKHIRAKLKHFRYAHALYGVEHRYPFMLNTLAIAMGKMQDAYKGGRKWSVLNRSLQLRALLSAPVVARVRAEGDRLVPASPAAFRALLLSDYAQLDAMLAAPEVTGHSFHAARKLVGRQGSFWNTLLTLEPNEDRYRMSRWLSAINGAMGAMHDQLVERRADDAASYHAAVTLPDEIRNWIAALLEIVHGAPAPAGPR